MNGYVPVRILQDLLDSMLFLKNANEKDMDEYKEKGFDRLYSLTEAHKSTTEIWMEKVSEIIRKCNEGEYDDELEDTDRN